jgi:guanylate kinase
VHAPGGSGFPYAGVSHDHCPTPSSPGGCEFRRGYSSAAFAVSKVEVTGARLAGILFIISAPSGSGKSTLVNQLRSDVSGLDFSISYTTREPRGSEEQGREYHYIDRATFEHMRQANEFLESADVFGNLYGTARHSLTDAEKHGNDLLLDIDVQGAEQVRRQMPESVNIFVMPPTPEVLATRLRNRSRAEGSISENYEEYGYILVNDVLDHAVEELEAIVASERFHRGQQSRSAGGEDIKRLLAIADRCRRGHAMERVIPVLTAFRVAEPARTR